VQIFFQIIFDINELYQHMLNTKVLDLNKMCSLCNIATFFLRRTTFENVMDFELSFFFFFCKVGVI